MMRLHMKTYLGFCEIVGAFEGCGCFQALKMKMKTGKVKYRMRKSKTAWDA